MFSLQGTATSSQLLGSGASQLSTAAAAALVVLAAIELIAGLLVFRLLGAGRVLGLGVAGVEVLYGLKLLIDGQGTAALAIGVNLFVIYALTTTGDVFARARRR